MPGPVEKVGGIGIDAEIDLDKLEKGFDAMFAELKKLDPQLQKTEKNLKDVERTGKTAGTAFKGASVQVKGLFKTMVGANLAAQAMQKTFHELFRLLKFGMTEPLKQAIKFETTMAKLSTIIEGDARKAVQGLSKDVREMAIRFGGRQRGRYWSI